jgi:hypothetical protein
MPRVTITVRNTEGLQRKLATRDRAVRKALLRVVHDSGQRVYEDAYQRTPVESGYMQDKLTLSYHRDDYTYHLGWYAKDFLGTMRTRRPNGLPQPRPFYVPPVVLGSAGRAGNDPLTPALEHERPQFRREATDAMRVSQ